MIVHDVSGLGIVFSWFFSISHRQRQTAVYQKSSDQIWTMGYHGKRRTKTLPWLSCSTVPLCNDEGSSHKQQQLDQRCHMDTTSLALTSQALHRDQHHLKRDAICKTSDETFMNLNYKKNNRNRPRSHSHNGKTYVRTVNINIYCHCIYVYMHVGLFYLSANRFARNTTSEWV